MEGEPQQKKSKAENSTSSLRQVRLDVINRIAILRHKQRITFQIIRNR